MKLRMGSRMGIAAMAAIAAVTIAGLAGCGGKGDDTGSSSTGTDAASQYRDCLAKNGVTLPSNFARGSGRPGGNFPSGRPSGFPSGFPTVRPSGGNGNGGGGFGGFPGAQSSEFAKAEQVCASLRPSGQPGFGGNRGGGANAAYRNCLTEHGVTMNQGQQLNTADPKVVEAMKTCSVLRPSAAPSN
ncbi:hypothetical protein [Hamadaea tsunoensis]|uniref:hypothetical protein n=1 Tax=Hamadaea tsunoensis TaxID=53368 RepID=UPI0003FBCB1A|nr:hypothetical protein [Hamadaea tsunoensis]